MASQWICKNMGSKGIRMLLILTPQAWSSFSFNLLGETTSVLLCISPGTVHHSHQLTSRDCGQ